MPQGGQGLPSVYQGSTKSLPPGQSFRAVEYAAAADDDDDSEQDRLVAFHPRRWSCFRDEKLRRCMSSLLSSSL